MEATSKEIAKLSANIQYVIIGEKNSKRKPFK